MKQVEIYARVRHAVLIEGISERAAAERFGINARTVSKMLKFSVPPGYVRTKPPFRPKLDAFIGIIDVILAADKVLPKKQRHTAKRIFERLCDEHGFTGKVTIVKDYVAGWRQRSQEMFVPLVHPPGHAQVDFGEAIGVIGGVERKIHFLAMDLPHSDAIFVVGYPAETTEAFCDGHVKAFDFFGGVPQSILYDNTRIAVARILGDGKRQRTRVFSELQSHYLFNDRFGRPGKGNDKGKVEGLVGYARRNFMVPIPVFADFEALNVHLLESCRKRLADRLRGHDGTIGERLAHDLAAFQRPLPAPYDACEKRPGSVNSLSLVRYQNTDYSVPTAYGYRQVLIRGYVHEVVIANGAEVIARPRYLMRLAEMEMIDRERRMVERRIKAAKFPTVKSLDSFDFLALPSLNKMLVLELARSDYVERRENIIALGNSGTGKSHIALGLGLAACQKGLSAGFITASALVHELLEARDEKRLLRLQRQLAAYKLLIIDELGYVPLSPTGAELLFEVFSQRYERGSTLVTSNLPFDEWTSVFGSERLTGALLDRLTHHVHILEMNGDSFRLAHSKRRSRQARSEPPSDPADQE